MSYDLLRGGEILGEAAVEGRDVGRVLGRSPSGCGEVTSSPTPRNFPPAQSVRVQSHYPSKRWRTGRVDEH